MAFVPPAPALPGEALLEIFIYPDPAFAANRALDESNKFSDTARLEYLGRKATELVYMDLLRTRWPHSSAEQLQGMVDNGFNALLERAASAYQWSQRVHGYPVGFDRNSPQESRRLFCVYAGAVHVEYGYERLKGWVAELR
ncbi:hypothetical protein FKP32DRAFT_1595131 [Trametes sanguinea]|nr:hypothetical protein FKP32DRAFT_1595131 [Trametes sanguinea]